MLKFTKDGGFKMVSEENAEFIKLIIKHGWIPEPQEEETAEKKEVKNGKSSKSSNKSDLSVGAE